MDNALTGNVYMGYVPYEPDAEKVTAWSYVMQTNLAALSSPFLLFPVDEAYLQSNIGNIIMRAGLSEALDGIGIEYTDYANPKSASIGAQYQNMLRNNYKDYLISEAISQNKVADPSKAETFVKSAPMDWVEETVAKKFTSEKYSKIATLEEIETLVGQKLSGTIVEHAIYEEARKKASDYIANIKSLRVIAKETLFADMTDAEYEATYGCLGVLDFEKAVYDYLKANYEKENNLTEADYEKLVQDFIATCLKFSDPKTKQEYTYSWDEFLAIKEKSAKFSTPLQVAKAQYAELIKQLGGVKQEQIDSWDDVTLANNILTTLRTKYYNSLNTSEAEFSTMLYDKVILAPFSITKRDLDILKVKDNALYKDYLKKVKKTYKAQLLESYTKEEYEAMTDLASLSAVLEYYIETYTTAYAQLCGTMGVSRSEYTEYYGYAEKYIKCVDTMKKTFIYTLRTRYTDEEVNAMTVAQKEKAVFDIVYESGYYMNELAKCIGIDLSKFNYAKSDAIAYLGDASDLAYKPGYLTDTIRHYEKDLAKAGYTIDDARALEPEEIEALLREIIRERYFAEYKTIDVELVNLCKSYVDGVEVYSNMKDYCANAAKELSENYLFDAIVGYLNDSLQDKLAKENAAA
jgi:hypothetical protein